mmetsp:Transcript_4798/g.8712  ORF Transcript_4798/g.8712 Transcript_4798/m.8712 type:complete len:82 (+) Transcript_4798:308-553(+)|eukprot:CAMPEP_0177768574 /NCGR_PEP_ID=MMETSP0491_2-20121128/9800_1 /TAXON_ID=63592 /ORGANISM="Tetraselmis chuii, Strain PLY429" /LENGTH=81 /DNA_ID=CAMNT_0019285403 /DNA_START=280 /DNA_END=525 /DNA_ORIENTATION=+
MTLMGVRGAIGSMLSRLASDLSREARGLEQSSQKVLEIVFKGPLKGPVATDVSKHRAAEEAVTRATSRFRESSAKGLFGAA